MDSIIGMNKFDVVDMPGMNTIAFLVEKSGDEAKSESAMLSLQKIESIDSQDNGKIKKTFSVVKTGDMPQLIVLLTLTNSRAIISTGELSDDGFKATQSNVPLSYGSIFNQSGVEYKEVDYTPNYKRHFSIIDIQTGEEVKPVVFRDELTGGIKGRCKILPNKPYIVLELRYDN